MATTLTDRGVGDPRLIGVVNDPRPYARDYEGSDMGEVAMPPGTPPDEILGVYRARRFDPPRPPISRRLQLLGTRPSGGTAQFDRQAVHPHPPGYRACGWGWAVVSGGGRGRLLRRRRAGDRLPADAPHGLRPRRTARQRRYARGHQRGPVLVTGQRGMSPLPSWRSTSPATCPPRPSRSARRHSCPHDPQQRQEGPPMADPY